MLKKFHWGHGIVLFILIFFISIFIRVYFSYQHDINLVSQDYYPKGINHQQHIEKEANYRNLKSKPVISIDSEFITLKFPSETKTELVQGNIHFYRPSDPELDKKYQIKLNSSGIQKFQNNNFKYGRYVMKIDFSDSALKYYFEQEVLIK